MQLEYRNTEAVIKPESFTDGCVYPVQAPALWLFPGYLHIPPWW